MIPALTSHAPHPAAPADHGRADDALLPWALPHAPPAALLGLCRSNEVATPGLRRSHTLAQAVTADTPPKPHDTLGLTVEQMAQGYGSSGSRHDPSSVSLFAMVHEFMENDGLGRNENGSADDLRTTDLNRNCAQKDGAEDVSTTLKSLAMCADERESDLLDSIQQSLEYIRSNSMPLCERRKAATVTHSCLKRSVMSHLRKKGYNAAVCKTKWDHMCGTPAGDYEYIDVQQFSGGLQSDSSERVIVDIDFQSQFKIARPSEEFQSMWRLLPPIFVGKVDRLKLIIKIMSEATKQSLKAQGLHLPPWRKPAYMKAKWLSGYRRTTNGVSSRPCKEKGLAIAGDEDLAANCIDPCGDRNFESDSKREGELATPHPRVAERLTVVATDWQPPAVDSHRAALRKRGAITGLSSLLLRGPSDLCSHPVVQVA